jgi:hypothetical protein
MRAIPESVSQITHQLTARILQLEDSENIRIRKVVFLYTTIAGTLATIIWALILLAIDLTILGGFMAFVGSVSISHETANCLSRSR